jgi:hypothetical protein
MAYSELIFRAEDFVLPPPLSALPLKKAVVIQHSGNLLRGRLTFQGSVEHPTVLGARVLLQNQIHGFIYSCAEKRTPTDSETTVEIDFPISSKGADMSTAESVPPQYSPGDVVATSDGVEWMIEAIKGTEADLVRFRGPSHSHATRPLTSLKLLRGGSV